MKPPGSSISARDSAVLWHPYTQHATEGDVLPVVAAQGAYLHLADGRKILDAISSWWVNLHGHGHPEIAAAIAAQAGALEQVIFAGFTHEPAVALAETLTGAARAASAQTTRAFYSDNGSTAVEVALKMAFQFHLNRGETGRVRFIALHNGYHGDTLGAMAASEPEGFHPQFRRLLPPVDFIPVEDLAALDRLLAQRPGEHAAFIFEPMIQGAGGMKTYSTEFLRGAAERCRAVGIPLIADEIFTGFFRTGKCFAFEHAGISPDLICLSKGVTGGFMPLGVTLATEEIYSAFLHDDKAKAFLHGHSYTGSPLACAAALKSWEILHRSKTQAQIKMITARTTTHLAALAKRPAIAATRQIGTIGAIEITEPSGKANYFSAIGPVLRSAALARGVLLRPLGNVLYAVPPYCVTEAEVDRIYETMGDILDALET